MKEIPFIVSARTAKLIWQENFSNANWAIVELVKNSYDADARNVFVLFHMGSLYIVDNWDWMNRNIIENNWMKIWTDNKLLKFETNWKRIKSWAKWIGRFALDRLWVISEMYTVYKETSESLYWKVNWSDFETNESISKVSAEIDDELQDFHINKFLVDNFSDLPDFLTKITDIDFSWWTIIKITNLRDRWLSNDINNLFDSLEILTPPTQSIWFSISLYSDLENTKNWKINTANYDEYDYKVFASYLWNEKLEIELEFIRHELDTEKLERNFSEVFSIWKMWKFPYDLETIKKGYHKSKISLLDLWYNEVDQKLLKNIWKFNFEFFFIKNTFDEYNITKFPYLDINTYRKNLNSYFLHLMRMKYINDNPMKRLLKAKESDKSQPCATQEQIDRLFDLLENVWDTLEHLRNLLYFRIALLTGARPVEILNMNLESFTLGRTELKLSWAKQNSKARHYEIGDLSVLLSKYLKAVSESWRSKELKNHLFLSLSEDWKPLTSNWINKLYQRIAKKLWFTVNTYMIRRFAATLLHKNWVDINAMMDFLWHTRFSTTKKYIQNSSEFTKKATDIMSRVLKKN
ncbi:MAG: putative histidine kinase [uncultured bacterium (gcode 4)]|uniref:Putative histidine kinase n=1 Tax=uncultured bacterium (gcode 4) TaxID=1234023 RepID=K2GDK3_9BACT|nr:MAG: putative histidine kinase [uncultured bacterium (gcode 4)]